MKLRTKIAMGSLGFLTLALFFCCVLLISTNKKAMLENAMEYTSQEEKKLVASMSSHENQLSQIENQLTASAVLKYYFFQETQNADLESEYVLQYKGEDVFNNTGINVTSAIDLTANTLEKNAVNTQIIHLGDGDYCISGKSVDLCGKNYQIFVVRDITALFTKIRVLIWECIGMGVVISILACGLTILFIRKTLTPLENLQIEAEAIASGQYNRRLMVAGKDEVAVLADSFNSMAQSVEQHVRKVEETSEARNQLIHALAHEMRTPVTAICGYSYALKSVKMNDEQKAEAIDFIDMEARRMERLSGKLTALVGLTNHPHDFQEINLSAWSTQLTQIFRGDERISIVVENNKKIRGDQDLLTMLITNLCDNAKNADASEIKITIRNGEIQVKDNGKGISSDQLDKIFQAFYQGDDSRNQEGFGLGLSLCQKIAQIHGTVLSVESEEGRGSCFSMNLYNSLTSL